jgi:L-ascorbate metabolism protein UlaG (beta-lactamase superfamily)
LQSLNHPDFNGGENMFYGDKEPYVVTGPGEYEVKDIIMRGFQTNSEYDGEKGINTVYSLTFEGMHVVFLGAVSEKELPKDILADIDEVDILFVPIAGKGLLDASEAYKLAVKLNPRLIIPMNYEGEKDKALQTFLKEGGVEKAKAEEKITLKRKDLDGMEGDIAVLKAQ